MPTFSTNTLPAEPTAIAPDGSAVRVLAQLDGGGMAHFQLAPHQTSVAVAHHTVEEIWYVLSGEGRMWRRQGDVAEVVTLGPGTCLTLPVGTHFQFRCDGDEPLRAVGVTMPPWPGAGEARVVDGAWEPSVEPGPA
jgi:mannose-6-phosphate isomerase-like protein (cupin superfamily)